MENKIKKRLGKLHKQSLKMIKSKLLEEIARHDKKKINKKHGSKTSRKLNKGRSSRDPEEEGELSDSDIPIESYTEYSSLRSSFREEAFTEDEKTIVKRARKVANTMEMKKWYLRKIKIH